MADAEVTKRVGLDGETILDFKLPRGPKGDKGDQGDKGADGSNVLPTDTAVANAITTNGTATKTALNAAFVDKAAQSARTEAEATDDAMVGSPVVVTLMGHSQPYGQDTIGGTLPPANGAGQARSTTPPPETMQAALQKLWGAHVTVQNYGFPGDTSTASLARWEGQPLGDIAIFWCDSNDYANGIPTAETRDNAAEFIRRCHAEGAQPVIIGGHTVGAREDAWGRQGRAEAMRRVAERMGAPYYDAQELLSGQTTGQIWTDGAHLIPSAFAEIGTRLAALVAVKREDAPKIGPGSEILPRHHRIHGGTIDVRTNAVNDNTITIPAGQRAMVPLNVVAPVRPRFDFYAGLTAGTGRIRYAQGLGGLADRGVNIHATSEGSMGVSVMGHQLQPGLNLVEVECLTGTLYLERVAFAEPADRLEPASNTVRQNNAPRLTGTVFSGIATVPRTQADWNFRADQSAAIALVEADGTTARAGVVSFDVATGTPDATCTTTVIAVASRGKATAWGVREGIGLRRDGTAAIIRRWDNGGGTNVETVAAVFPAGEWAGRIDAEFKTNGTVQFYVNRVAVGAPVTIPWKHVYPAVLASGYGAPITVRGSTTIA